MAKKGKGSDDTLLILIVLAIALMVVGSPIGGKGPDTTVVAGQLKDIKVVPDSTTVPGYTRTSFGPAWSDVDRNGCDTRNDILARDLSGVVKKTGSNCVVTSGVLNPDPYTGQRLAWKKGDQPGVDIDHIVPLKRAWTMGASTWTPQQRLAYANDPDVLLAVSGSENRAKADKGPGEWMPANEAYSCTYARKYVAVSVKYELAKGLATCQPESVPTPTATATPVETPTATATPVPTSAPTTPVSSHPIGMPRTGA